MCDADISDDMGIQEGDKQTQSHDVVILRELFEESLPGSPSLLLRGNQDMQAIGTSIEDSEDVFQYPKRGDGTDSLRSAKTEEVTASHNTWAGKGVWQRARKKLSPAKGAQIPRYKAASAWGHAYTTRILALLSDKYRPLVTAIYAVVCGILVYVMFAANNYLADTELGPPQSLSCDSYEWGSARSCGVAGVNCEPFLSDTFTPYRCPPWCGGKTGAWYVVGNNPFYRADSRICLAAVHSGVISNARGGCVRYRQTGPSATYNSSYANGVQSFNSTQWFAKSFELKPCTDPKACEYFGFQVVLPVTTLLYIGLILLGVNSLVYYASIMVVGFWYVALISQPVPSYSFIEACMGRFLPFLFIAYMLYLYGGKTAIPPPTHMLERFALYWFPAWFFVHMNYLTFIFPDEDITGGEQVVTDDGGIAVVQPPVSWNPLAITLMVAACSIALFLLYKLFRAIWRSGRTLPYLTGYISALAVLILFAVAVSSQYFVHLHHYQLGMAIWPITAFSMGPAAFAQSIMAGLYIQGVARWGFGSTFTYTGYRPKTPDFVGNITISNETTDGALVEWPAANYTIAPVYSVVVNTIEMCRVTDTQCRISGLLPGLSYHVCVRNVVEGYEGSCEGNQRFNTTAAPDL